MDDQDKGVSRRSVIIGAGLLAASGVAFAGQPRNETPPLKKGQIDAMVPSRIGGWTFESSSGLILPPPDALSERTYDEIVTRVYTSENQPPVMFLVAYSNTQDGMLQVHRPETCYPVGGFRLSDSRVLDIPMPPDAPVQGRFFTAESASRTEQVLYWTRIGSHMPGRWIDQRWAVVDENLRGNIPDGILVRFSAIEPDAKAALATLELFARDLVSGLKPDARRLFIGR